MDLNLQAIDVLFIIFGIIGLNFFISVSKMILFKIKIRRIQNISKLRRRVVLRRERLEIKKKKRVMNRMKKTNVYNINRNSDSVNMGKPANLNPRKEETPVIIKEEKPQIIYDTKRDMEFLEHLIQEKCTAYVMIELSDFLEDERSMASEDLIRESVKDIGLKVYNSLSKHYLERLSYYFDKNELLNYIFDKAFVTVAPIIVNKHKNNIG